MEATEEVLEVSIPKIRVTSEYEHHPYEVYEIKVENTKTKATFDELKRYFQFEQLQKFLLSNESLKNVRIPALPLDPAKSWSSYLKSPEPSSREDLRRELEVYLKELIGNPTLLNLYQVRFFLGIRKPSNGRKVVVPLPDIDFDPTELSVPWKLLSHEGYDFIFATENAAIPQGDPIMLRAEGVVFGSLGTEPEPKLFYSQMTSTPSFQKPISYSSIPPPTSYSLLLLTGGHAKGMRQYLESPALRTKVVEYWSTNRPVAAICHGTLLLARCCDDEQHSILRGRKTACLPKYLENMGYWTTRWKVGDYFKTYDLTVEDEMKGLIGAGGSGVTEEIENGSWAKGKGNLYEDHEAHVVVDGNYVSGRWPGDAYLYGKTIIQILEKFQEGEEEEKN